MEEINLPRMVENIRTSLMALLQEKGGLITFTGDLNIVWSAPEILQLILKNIIENGLKYNRSEVPEVMVKTTATENNYEIAISDNGIGIAKEFQDQIFQMFKRLHTRQEFEGTGMGLAICKKIIRRLGGEISIESEGGKGSTFLVQLPR